MPTPDTTAASFDLRGLLVAAVVLLACPRREPVELPPREPAEPDRGDVDDAADPGPRESSDAFEPPHDCESLCGLVYDCLLAVEQLDARRAAALELDCLSHCVNHDAEDSAGTLTHSRFASCSASTTCGELLPCVRTSWPTQPSPDEVDPELTPSPSGSGCREGCKRLGECFDAGAPLIDDCTRGCEDKLGDADETAFGECTRNADCVLMLECMKKFPGA